MEKALRIKFEGDIAHFQRPVSMSTKQTYRIPPRSAVAGLFAGGLGYASNEYYEQFDPEQTKIGVEVLNDISTLDLGCNFRMSQKSQTTKPSESLPRAQYAEDFVDASHVQESIEYVRNPEYNLYVMSKGSVIQDLVDILSEQKWHYQPYFGSSECFAEFTGYEKTSAEEIGETVEVDSVVPLPTVEKVMSTDIHTDRFVLNFEKDDKGRLPTGYYDQYYSLDSDRTIRVSPDKSVYRIDTELGEKNICMF